MKLIAERLADALALRMIDRDAFGVLQRDDGHRATLPLRRILARAKGGARITPADIENDLAAFFRPKETLDRRANDELLAVESAKLAARHYFELNGNLPDPDEGDEDNTVFAAIAAKRCLFKPIGSTAELNSRPSTVRAQ